MRLLSYLNDQVFCWNDLLNVDTSDVWKYLNYKQFVEILPLIEHHYIVITNLELSTEETNTIYIFEPCIEFSYREMDKDIKYPISFIKTCCNLLPKTQRKISSAAIYGADNHISGYCSECETTSSSWRF